MYLVFKYKKVFSAQLCLHYRQHHVRQIVQEEENNSVNLFFFQIVNTKKIN